jgi:hypothetical protein
MTSGAWVNGEPRLSVSRGSPLQFQIEELDAAAGSARVRLGAATEAVTVHAAGLNLHIIEQRSPSTMAMTTVLGKEGGPRFKAVHTRSDYYAYDKPGFTAAPQTEQLSGSCLAVS